MKNVILTSLGTVGGFIVYLLGGWDASVITLLILMLIDYITGLIVAGVFHKSKKSENGNLESHACWKGLCKKFVVLLFIIVANRLDLMLGGGTTVRDAVCISFIINEILSIVENAGLMGIPIPKTVTNAIAVLNKNEKDDKTEKG